MKALILAAGLGTRLGTLTVELPKPMLPIGGRPLLEHTVALLREHGVREIAINIHYRPEAICGYFGTGEAYGVRLLYSIEPQLLGTGGAAKRLEQFLDERFFVIYGDVLTDLDLTGLSRWHIARQAALSMALYRVEDPTRAGIVKVDGAGHISRFVEKPSLREVFSDLANTGIMVVEPEVLRDVPPGRVVDFGTDVLPAMLGNRQRVCGRLADAYVLDIGSPERYWQAQRDAGAGRIRLRALNSAIVAGPPGRIQC